jgi:Asp-tRNA(Asn)/Glu-tRNA(Gln) amidotransferase A subunit family amidase
VPCGTTDFDGAKNLPVGLQILAPHLEEAKLLRIAKAAES